MSIKNGLFLSSENVWLFILAFFWKRAYTYRYRCYKDGRFFIPIFFSKHAHTHRYEFCKVAYLFHLKMSEFLFLRFSEKTHTRTDIDVIKMADFPSAFSFQKTHTCTDMNFTKWFICFISKCLNFYSCFFLKRRTHAQISML